MAENGTTLSPAIGIVEDGAYTTNTPRTLILKHKSVIGFDFSVDDAEGNRVFSVLRTHFHKLTVLNTKTEVVGSVDIAFPRPWDRNVLRPDDSKLLTIRAKEILPSFTTEMDLFMEGDENEPSYVAQFKEGAIEDMHVLCTKSKQEIAAIHYASGKLPHSDTLTISVPAGGDYALAVFIGLAAHAIYHS